MDPAVRSLYRLGIICGGGALCRRHSATLVATLITLVLAGCGIVVERDGPGRSVPLGNIDDAVPKDEPQSKYGNPDSYVVNGKRYYTMNSAAGFRERGIASWYGSKFHGRNTSSGEVYDMYKMTAAHKSVPLPTYVEVRNLENNRTAIVKVNDRGPFHDNRVIDLSYAAALKLDFAEKGTTFVEVRAVDTSGVATAPLVAGAAPAIATNAGIYLQVGAFKDRHNAVRLHQQVGKYVGESVHIREIAQANGALYRVQIGPIANVNVADTIVQALTHIGIYQHYFVLN